MNAQTRSRIALVTGAGSGIGRAVALGLLDDGFIVVLAGRRPEPLQALVADAAARHQRAMAVPTDVCQPDSVQSLFDTIERSFGRLDLLFNNAGVNAPAVTGVTKALVLDGRSFGIVASQIDIGNALTELSERMTRGVLQANGTVAPEPMMDASHVADAVRHIAAMPLSANVLNMTVMASTMPFVGRG
jgi:NADP-dependent 3-hydroxy acid dehydrogenase YdfG